MAGKVKTNNAHVERDIASDPINFQSSLNKFAKLSEQEIEQRNALTRSRQVVITSRLLCIKGEMKMLEGQLKANEQ